MATILVTGGCGFIGSNLLPMLAKEGWTLRVLDNLSGGSKEHLRGLDVELVEGDIRDLSAVRRAMHGAHAVIHLAAFGSVVDSVADPEPNFRVNAEGTFTVLRGCIAENVSKLVFSSTGGALIGNAPPPVNEQSLPKPISPYGASKLCCEGYINAFSHSYGLSSVILRFANIYGPISGHKKGAVTNFFKGILTGKPLVLFGDGSSTRDYLYVEDLCRGIVAALGAKLPSAQVLHLASGRETSVLELAKSCAKVAGVDAPNLEFKPERPGEVARNFARYDLAREMIGFNPGTGLDQGLALTWAWFRDNREKFGV